MNKTLSENPYRDDKDAALAAAIVREKEAKIALEKANNQIRYLEEKEEKRMNKRLTSEGIFGLISMIIVMVVSIVATVCLTLVDGSSGLTAVGGSAITFTLVFAVCAAIFGVNWNSYIR